MAQLPDGWVQVVTGVGKTSVTIEKYELVKCRNCQYRGVPAEARGSESGIYYFCHWWNQRMANDEGWCNHAERK